MMVICIKQHLSNIWSSIHEKVKQHWGWVEKMLLIKKVFVYERFDLEMYAACQQKSMSKLNWESWDRFLWHKCDHFNLIWLFWVCDSRFDKPIHLEELEKWFDRHRSWWDDCLVIAWIWMKNFLSIHRITVSMGVTWEMGWNKGSSWWHLYDIIT